MDRELWASILPAVRRAAAQDDLILRISLIAGPRHPRARWIGRTAEGMRAGDHFMCSFVNAP